MYDIVLALCMATSYNYTQLASWWFLYMVRKYEHIVRMDSVVIIMMLSLLHLECLTITQIMAQLILLTAMHDREKYVYTIV